MACLKDQFQLRTYYALIRWGAHCVPRLVQRYITREWISSCTLKKGAKDH